MRWWVVSGVLWASVAAADERGFQLRATADVGVAAVPMFSWCGSCQTRFAGFIPGPMASISLAPGWRFGLVSIHGGGELQWTLFTFKGHSVRLGPTFDITFHVRRWMVLSLEAKFLFPIFGDVVWVPGGNVRWGFELSRDGRHQLTASVGAYGVSGVTFTTSIGYLLTLGPSG